jgi:hypothetical protein
MGHALEERNAHQYGAAGGLQKAGQITFEISQLVRRELWRGVTRAGLPLPNFLKIQKVLASQRQLNTTVRSLDELAHTLVRRLTTSLSHSRRGAKLRRSRGAANLQ